MADHVRKQIRAAAVTALTGLATTGARVFASRVYPLQDSDIPGLRISNPEEAIEAVSVGGANRFLERTLTLEVQGCVKQVSGYEDLVDQIAKEVETALANNNTLGALCKYITPRGIETELSGEAEKPIAVATLRFEVVYYTALNAPDVPS
jgi:hypothetical protein